MPDQPHRPSTRWTQLPLPGHYHVLTVQCNWTWYPVTNSWRWTAALREPRDRVELAHATNDGHGSPFTVNGPLVGLQELVRMARYLGQAETSTDPHTLAEHVSLT